MWKMSQSDGNFNRKASLLGGGKLRALQDQDEHCDGCDDDDDAVDCGDDNDKGDDENNGGCGGSLKCESCEDYWIKAAGSSNLLGHKTEK